MATEGIPDVIFCAIPVDQLLPDHEHVLKDPPVWPRPSEYTGLVPTSTGEDGFWWFDEGSIPESSRHLFKEACEEGARLCKYLLTKEPNKKRVKCLRRLNTSLMKLLIHQEEYDLDYGLTIKTGIEQRWKFVRDCMVRFCLAEKVYTERALRDVAKIPFSIPLQARFIAASDRAYTGLPTVPNLNPESLLICDLENPETPEHRAFYTSFLAPIVEEFGKNWESLFLPVMRDSYRNEYSIFQSYFSMAHPASPKDVESLIPTLRISPQNEATETDTKTKKNLTDKPNYLPDQSHVNAEQLELCQRSQLVLQHYHTLHTFLDNWFSDTGPGEEGLWSQSDKSQFINLAGRKCGIMQKAAWYIVANTESLWETCRLHRVAGNFDEDEAKSRLPKLKRWLMEMLVIAVSVQIDGWRTYHNFYETPED